MPDLMSHLIIALILSEIFNIKKKSIVALGALLPDVLSKGHLAYLHLNIAPAFSFMPFHTPAILFLLSIIICSFFRYGKLKIILWTNLGSISHFLSDLTMKHFTIVGTRLFFPFSMSNYTLNLIWPEKSIYVLLFLSVAYVLIRFIKKSSVLNTAIRPKRNQKNKDIRDHE